MTSLTVDSDNLLLLTGDIEGEIMLLFVIIMMQFLTLSLSKIAGYLCLWKIEKYCVSKSATLPPKSKTDLYYIAYRQCYTHYNNFTKAKCLVMKLIGLYICHRDHFEQSTDYLLLHYL